MSEPMTNVDIEDVLASIRRLVSEDARPRSAPPPLFTPRPRGDSRAGAPAGDRATQEAPTTAPVERGHPADRDLGATAMADPAASDTATDSAREAKPMMSPAFVHAKQPDLRGPDARVQPERLVLTPSLRVMVPDQEALPPGEDNVSDDATEADPPLQPWQDPTALLIDVWPDAALSPGTRPDQLVFAGSDDAAQNRPHRPDRSADDHTDPVGDTASPETGDPHDAPSDASDSLADDFGGWSDDRGDTDLAMPLSDRDLAADDATHTDALAWEDHAADRPDSDIDADPDMSPITADEISFLTPDTEAAPRDPAPEQTWPELADHELAHHEQASPDDRSLHTGETPTTAPFQAQAAPGQDGLRGPSSSGADAAGDEADLLAQDTIIDEAMLRDLVADIVRQELMGALGERITRNVRKLVRREIHRALSAQEFE